MSFFVIISACSFFSLITMYRKGDKVQHQIWTATENIPLFSDPTPSLSELGLDYICNTYPVFGSKDGETERSRCHEYY